MFTDLFPLVSYVIISTYTPGPANVSSASLGLLHGYRKSLKFLGGLATGLFFVMLIGGGISGSLLNFFPTLEPILRYVGAAYILYLAFGILKASYTFADSEVQPLGFRHGLLLQFSNPKLMVYALTLFSGFLAPITGNAAMVVLTAVMLGVVAFSATSAWALFGMGIKTFLHNPRAKMIVNVMLSLSLVYVAITLL